MNNIEKNAIIAAITISIIAFIILVTIIFLPLKTFSTNIQPWMEWLNNNIYIPIVLSTLMIIIFIVFSSLKMKVNNLQQRFAIPVIAIFGLITLMFSISVDNIYTKSAFGLAFLLTLVLGLLFGFRDKYLELENALKTTSVNKTKRYIEKEIQNINDEYNSISKELKHIIGIFGLMTIFLPLLPPAKIDWWHHVIIAISFLFTLVFGTLLGRNQVNMSVGIPFTVTFGLLFLILPLFYEEYKKWWHIFLAFIGFTLTFIFSFLLGFKKVTNEIGIPILVIFGIIFLISSLVLSTNSTITLNDFSKYINGFTFAENTEYLKNDFLANIPTFVFIVLLSIVIYYANKDPDALTTNAYKYVFLIFIPFIIFMAYSMLSKTPENSFIALFMLCIVAIVGIYIWSSMNKQTLYIFSFFSKYLLIPLIVLIGFAIFYKIALAYISNLTGFSRFIIELIFFIPCMFIDFVEYIKQQFKITPSSVYILFIIEILLILFYMYLPKVVSKYIKSKSIILLQNPVNLNKQLLVSNSSITELINKDALDQITTNKQYRTNYSISFWTIINTHSTSNISSVQKNNIFKYGHIDSNNNENYKPYVSYVIDKETGDNYIFKFSNSEDSTYKISLPTQKWHNFVFNYNNSRVDLFINGKLEKTYNFRNDLPVYSHMDEFIAGNENGLDGAICNIQYFTVPLTNTDIANLYNINVWKNPPVE
jgi:hypothetical protein